MPSPAETRSASGIVLIAILCCAPVRGESNESDAKALTPAAVQAAVDTLRHDPNLPDGRKIRSLHWVGGNSTRHPPADAPSWLVSLFAFLSDSASWVVWVAGATGLAVAAVWIYRTLRSHQFAPARVAPPRSSNLMDLDIDPRSLPSDVGAAALTLLETGRSREALSLLYRGAVSRAVHRFAVVVGESFTEGEALRAVRHRLDSTRVQYFASLVSLWQRTVYAAEAPAPEAVAKLCREFSPLLDGTAVP